MARQTAPIDLLADACCVPLFGDELSATEAERLAGLLKVVADPARLRMLNMISAGGEVCGCDLEEPLGLSQPTVSHHLKVLAEAGLLTREKRGRWVYHRIAPDRLAELRDALAVNPTKTG